MGEKDWSQKLGARVLREAGLAPADVGKLQELPWKDFLAVATKAGRQRTATRTAAGFPPGRATPRRTGRP
jgi:para-nitrobenzyl esterase